MKTLMRVNKVINGQKGFGLAETLVTVAILGTAVVTFVAALSTGSIGVREYEQDATAQRLAQSQLEYTKDLVFDPAGIYSLIPAPSGYALTVNAAPVTGTDDGLNIQKIIVTVLRDGNSLYIVSGYKVNR